MRLADFDFDLPRELIAQHPAAERSASRLLSVDAPASRLADRQFRDLAELVGPGDVIVLNDTRVINARLFGVKSTGGQVEVLIERLLDAHSVLAQVRASKPPRAGSALRLVGGITARVVGREGDFHRLRFEAGADLSEYLARHGSVPLPPYIEHVPDQTDAARYQTVYARHPGAVAAPTAGLHFDQVLLTRLRQRGVAIVYLTLHVGAGTFQPVRADDVKEHAMHSEWFNVPEETVAAIRTAKRRGAQVLAVGTTTLRALESAAAGGELRAGYGETKLFILPGYRFQVVERLLTNFHLPKSTLFMLVCAFGGMDLMRAAYRHAVEQRYRFFSYGDAMLIERRAQA
ncbi:MAG: tRNA preQ1(34) S-adenosylmethionine ribosyltransferase-isomerase QueA [Burkholderiales bacterium]|nr:tRNA preQ1(34) S-adenosylmethionine ribosyltransferase-isomerase QueA [Burkholderiales bacterium]